MDIEMWIFVTAACLFSCCLGSACTYYAVNWSRDRQEEADQQRRENAIEHGLKLAQDVQQLEQRISGDTPTVEMYDQATERQCNNCAKPAVFAWQHDGLVPMAACNFCVSLWFEDGLPDQVERIGQIEPSSQVNQVERDDRPCSECGTGAALCAQLALSETGLAGCCGTCATTGTTHPALVDPRLIHLVAERQALNDWADAVASPVDDDPADTLPRVLPEGRVSD